MEEVHNTTPEAKKPVQTFTLMTPEQIKQKSEAATQPLPTAAPIEADNNKDSEEVHYDTKPDKRYVPSYEREVIYKRTFFHQVRLFTSGIIIGWLLHTGYLYGIFPTSKADFQLIANSFKSKEIHSTHASPSQEPINEELASKQKFFTIINNVVFALPKARNAQRIQDRSAIMAAVNQFFEDNNRLPDGITEQLQEICTATTKEECPHLLMLHSQLGAYLPAIAQDPHSTGVHSGYGIKKEGNNIAVEAINLEVELVINRQVSKNP